jgi:hypothetical protein
MNKTILYFYINITIKEYAMTSYPNNVISAQAELLAKENVKAEPNIKTIYWFPNDNEVRLVEVEDSNITPRTLSGCVEPFYFDPSPADDLPAPSGVAIIRSDEVEKLSLPESWGTWSSAKKIEINL